MPARATSASTPGIASSKPAYVPVVAAPSRRRLHLVIHDFEPGWDTYIERQGTAPTPT